jgi:hypothetical protein
MTRPNATLCGLYCLAVGSSWEISTAEKDKLNLFDLAAMKRTLVRIFVAILASFALFAFVFPGGLTENDSPYSQSEMSKEFSVNIAAHRNQQSLAVDSQRLFASNKNKCSASSSGKTTSPTLLSLAACVLRC